MEPKQLFRGVDIFRYLTDSQLDRLAGLAVKVSLAKGDIFRELDAADGLYVIESGMATVTKSTTDTDGVDTILDVLRQGSSFGEISVIDGLQHSANVNATGPMECYFVPREAFMLVLKESAELAVAMLRALGSKVRSANNWASGPSDLQHASQRHAGVRPFRL